MYQRTLVPLDGSSAAEMVLPYAAEIAAKLGSQIILVGVTESIPTDVDRLYHSYLERVTEQLRTQIKDRGIEDETMVRNEVLGGDPANEILRYADKTNVSLIAMTSRGASVKKGPWLLGSTAAKIIRATSKPVMLIRAPASSAAIKQRKLFKRILVPLDGSKIGEGALPHTDELAQASGAAVVLFQAVQLVTITGPVIAGIPSSVPQDKEEVRASTLAYLDSVAKPLREKGVNVSSIVDFGSSPADQIIDYAKAHAIDIVAMSTHGRSGIGRWVFGSVTDKVLHAGKTAIFVVRAKA